MNILINKVKKQTNVPEDKLPTWWGSYTGTPLVKSYLTSIMPKRSQQLTVHQRNEDGKVSMHYDIEINRQFTVCYLYYKNYNEIEIETSYYGVALWHNGVADGKPYENDIVWVYNNKNGGVGRYEIRRKYNIASNINISVHSVNNGNSLVKVKPNQTVVIDTNTLEPEQPIKLFVLKANEEERIINRILHV